MRRLVSALLAAALIATVSAASVSAAKPVAVHEATVCSVSLEGVPNYRITMSWDSYHATFYQVWKSNARNTAGDKVAEGPLKKSPYITSFPTSSFTGYTDLLVIIGSHWVYEWHWQTISEITACP